MRKLGRVAENLHPGQSPKYVHYRYSEPTAFQEDLQSTNPGERATRSRKTGAIPVPYKLPEVCEACNTGWMGRLEQVAQRVMGGFTEGKRKLLAPYDQFVLGTWMIKTCLTYDSALEPRLISEDIGTRLFFSRGYPIPLCYVTIGHDANMIPQGEMLEVRRPRVAVHSDVPTLDLKAAQFTFQFDHLILDAVINYSKDFANSPGSVFFPNPSPKRNLIWPVTQRFVWPSDAALSAGDATSGTDETVPGASA